MQVAQAIRQHPEWFVSSTEQRIIHKIAMMMFTPALFAKTRKLVHGADKLIRQCKGHGYAVYILSNWDAESFAIVKNQYKDFFALFDGIVTSGETGFAKPSPEIYEYILQKYNLDPQQTIFVDDQPANIEAAQACNIEGILFSASHDSLKTLQHQLPT